MEEAGLTEYVVFPACAGMSLSTARPIVYISGFPRMRGDEPFLHMNMLRDLMFSPHARG